MPAQETERRGNNSRRAGRAYGDAVDTLCGRYTAKRVVVKHNTVGTFTVQKRTRRCVAYYRVSISIHLAST